MEYCKARPSIGSKVKVYGFLNRPFIAKVVSYDQCDDDSIEVERPNTERWVANWAKCKVLIEGKTEGVS
jgi:hypothetical protein